MIRFGSAGWSYADWEGVVYPEGGGRRFDALAWLARFVDCIEVNATFYRIPPERTAASWAERLASREGFRLTVKLWQGFTHGRHSLSAAEMRDAEKAFRSLLRPLRQVDLLGAVLVQYPYSFHNTGENRERLRDLVSRFQDLPLALEVRHTSWMQDEFLGWLRENGVAFCNIDQPDLSSNIPPTRHVTSGLAYVRLHGRNADAWFSRDAGRDRRYDYLYSEEELAGWAERIEGLAGDADELFVIANNHFRGQGMVNILELKAILEDGKVPAPGPLLRTYPRLGRRATPVEPDSGIPRDPAQGALPF